MISFGEKIISVR